MAGPGGKEVGRISIRVVPDTDRFREELKAQLEAIEKSLKGKVEVKADLDTGEAVSKLRAFQAAMKDVQSIKAKADIDFGSAAKFHATMAKLRAEAANDIKIKVQIDRNFLQVAARDIGTGLANTIGTIGSAAFSAGSQIAGMARGLAITVALAALVAPALALVAGALVTLPALLTAVVAPIGVVALGLDGIKKAAATVKPEFDALKQTVSNTFETGLTPVFENLKTTLFPLAQDVLPKVADGLVNMGKGFSDAVTSAPGMEALRNTFTNIGTALTNASPGVKSFTDGLLVLVDKVSARFPHLAQQFSELGGKFAQWVTDFTTADPSTGVSKLDTALTNLKGTLAEVSGLVADVASWSFDNISDPNFGATMKGFANDLRGLVTDTLPAFEKSFSTIAGFVDKISSAMDKLSWVGKIFGAFDSNGEGDKKFADQSIGEKLLGGAGHNFENQIKEWWNGAKPPEIPAELTTAIGDQGSQLGQTAQEQFQSGWAGGGGGSFDAKIAELGPQIKSATEAALVPVQQIPAQIQTAFAGVGAAVTGSMATVVSSVAGAGQQIVAAFSASLAQLPGVATTALSGLVGAVTGAMAQVVAAITSGSQQALAAVQSMGQQIVAALQQASSGAAAAGAQIGAGMATGIAASTGQAVAAAISMAQQVAAASKGALGIHSPSKVFTEIGDQTMQGLKDGLEGGFQGVLDRAKAIAQQLADTINGGLTGVGVDSLQDPLKKSLAELELQRKDLKVQFDAVPKTDKEGRKALQGQMDQITTLKDQLSLQKDQLGFSEKYGESLDKNDNLLGDSLGKMVDIGTGFAQANLKQFQSDLGISGNGAISQLADIGLGWGSQMLSKLVSGGFGNNGTTIQVGSVDEAFALKQRQDNKQALQYTK